MSTMVRILLAPLGWPISLIPLLLAFVFLINRAVSHILTRGPLPSGALAAKGWPLLGSIDFFRCRGDFLKDGREQSPNGHFSFYYGPHPIVALSGEAARQAYLNVRGLNLFAGFSGLIAAGPNVKKATKGVSRSSYIVATIKRATNRGGLLRVLGLLASDAEATITSIDVSRPFDPFDSMYRLVYQLSHRTIGCDDIAQSPELLDKTLGIYSRLDQSNALQVMFPSLPTPNLLLKVWSGAKLFGILKDIMKKRRETGQRGQDTMQSLMDKGDSDLTICAVIISALFAGVVNSGVNAAWVLCYLARDPYWYGIIQGEVDAAIKKHRVSDDQTPIEVLKSMSLADWESEFPHIGYGLKDSIRKNLAITSVRKNTSGSDLVLGDTGVVVPNDAYVTYGLDEVHMDPNIYKDPLKWDPSRYYPERSEDKKIPYSYLGWGGGLHPCVGSRFANLEITISTAMFVAQYDFQLCDAKGRPTTKPLPGFDHNSCVAKRPLKEYFLKCTPRQ